LTPTPTFTPSQTFSFSATVTATPTISPVNTPPVFSASVKIYNSAGEVVAVIGDNMPLSAAPQGLSVLQGSFDPQANGLGLLRINGPGDTVSWDGKSSSGQWVQSGSYTVVLQTADGFGKVQTWSASVEVLSSSTGVLVQVFNSAGELVWSQSSSSGTAGSIGLSSRQFVPSSSSSGLKISYGSGARDYAIWSGLNSQGQAVAGGTYLVQVTQDTETGKKIFIQSVIVLEQSATVFDQAIAWPNPAGTGTNGIMIQLSGMPVGSEAWGDVYNLAGERVGSLSADPAGLRWDLPPSSASGIYLARVSVRNSQGQQRSQTIKIAVLR
jgi:hypothetical protein